MVFDTLPTAFPWYDKIEKQARYQQHADMVCDYKLNSPSDALLPFEFRRYMSTFLPDKWEILNINTNEIVADISDSISQIRAKSRNIYDYFYYSGGALTASDGPLQLAPGYYYSRLIMSNGQQFFSEMFFVPDIDFIVSGSASSRFIKFEWYNQSDIEPVFYNDKDGGGIPYFRNVIYLDTFVHASEPEITEETTNDGNDTPIPTFQRAIIKYRVTDVVPDFLKVAIVLMQMHDTILLTTPGNIYSGQLERIETSSTLEANGFLSIVDILFEENLAMIRKACADNMPLPSFGLILDPGLVHVQEDGENVRIEGSVPAGWWGILWGSLLPGGPFETLTGPLQKEDLEADEVLVPLTVIGDKYFFYLEARNFNQSGLLSNTVTKT